MKVKIVDVKGVVTKSSLPDADFVINPYTGCQHGCIYCYAEFMKRFTNHKGEKWGSFVDIKRYDFNKIKPSKYNGKNIVLSSVTDPYQPLEAKHRSTRQILEQLKSTTANVTILSKSALIRRDIDLFKQFQNIIVGISISTLSLTNAKKLEPLASVPEARLKALKEVHDAGIKTYIFISPYLPGITEYEEIIRQTHEWIDQIWWENINFRPHNKKKIFSLISELNPEFLPLYDSLSRNPSEWIAIEDELRSFCVLNGIDPKFYFHHGGFSNNKKTSRTLSESD